MGPIEALRSHGREPGRAVLAARGTVFLAGVVTVALALLLVGRGAFADRFDAVALVDDAGGALVVGSDVKYDGVIVGRVGALTHDDEADRVRLDLELTPDLAADVPGDVEARILPASVFGTSFVDLVSPSRGAESAATLAAGQQIDQDRSRGTLEIQTILDGLDRVVGSLGPARLARTLDALSTALDGNGARLGSTLVRVDRYLARLNPQMPLVRRNLELLATNLDAFRHYAPDLFRATDDALVAARTLTERETDFRALVRSGSRTFGDTDRLLRDNRAALASTLVRTAVVVDALYDERDDVVRGVLSTIGLADGFGDALDHGRYLRIDGNLVLRGRDPYTRADCPGYGTHRGRGC